MLREQLLSENNAAESNRRHCGTENPTEAIGVNIESGLFCGRCATRFDCRTRMQVLLNKGIRWETGT